MNLKQAILSIMDRDTLKVVVDSLEIEGVDRRSAEDMRAKVSRSWRVEPRTLLAHLSEKQVKAVCEQMNVSPKGRRKELMERLLNSTGKAARMPAKPSLPRSRKTMTCPDSRRRSAIIFASGKPWRPWPGWWRSPARGMPRT
ncbi:hypothetical protein [Desulfatirhabdium butyrativorans]|uniref:hypothetical protein n=1 Tax=Desulfatirhabdium butyrativorans TaxID=340467 RepID=UPI000483F0C0|nr:hypothetical protein [Desulfatirhabdium butyrativorans]